MNNDSKPTPVRIALVGLGGHGRTIQQACEEAVSLEVVAVYDPVEADAQAAAERFGCDTAASYEAVLERDDLDAVGLVTPNHLHRPQAEAAFAAGLDVFVEKPIANTVADGQAMIDAAQTADRLLMVGHNMRFSRSFRMAKQKIDDGELGEIVSVEIHFSADNTQRMAKDVWRLRPDQCPLLPVMQLGIHALDLVHFMAGGIEKVHAFAQSVTTQPDVIDSVTATFRLDSGRLGTMVSNYCTPVRFEYRVAGTEGFLQCTPHHLWYRSAADSDRAGGGEAETHDFMAFGMESYVLQMQAFGEAVQQRTQPPIDGPAGLQALAVVEAMQRSAVSGAPQQVPSFIEHPSAA